MAHLVTVVIPARNEQAFIGRCLDSVLAQDYPSLEVLVVDGASGDATRAIVRDYARRDGRVRLLDNPRRVIPAALNVGLAAARGTWFVRVDAHSTIPGDYVGRIVRHFQTQTWGGVGGRIKAVAFTPAGRAIGAADASPFGVGNSKHHYGDRVQEMDHVTFGAYPVALARSNGGWNEDLLVNEDFEFDHRLGEAGHRIVFDPAIYVRWVCRQSIPELFSQYMRYGRGKPLVLALHPRSLKLRQLASPALVAYIATIGVLGALFPQALVGMFPYALALLVASAITAPKVVGIRSKLWVPFAFAAMHLGWGLGFWLGGPQALRARTYRRTHTPRHFSHPIATAKRAA